MLYAGESANLASARFKSSTGSGYPEEKMMDSFRPRRCLLYRRLWRARCCSGSPKSKASDECADEIQQQKALVRQLTRILTTSQLDTLARIVERRKFYKVQFLIIDIIAPQNLVGWTQNIFKHKNVYCDLTWNSWFTPPPQKTGAPRGTAVPLAAF